MPYLCVGLFIYHLDHDFIFISFYFNLQFLNLHVLTHNVTLCVYGVHYVFLV